MRTGAIFARGSCRALKWMALVGVVLVLGGGAALAQTVNVDTTKGGGDGIETAIRPSEGNRPEGADIFLDVTLHALVQSDVTADQTTTLTLAVTSGPATPITASPQTVTLTKHSGNSQNAEPRSVTTTFRLATQPDDGGEDDTVVLSLTPASPFDTTAQTINVELEDPQTQSYTLERPTADRSKVIRAGAVVALEFKSALEVEAETTYIVTTSNPSLGTVSPLAPPVVAANAKADIDITLTVASTARNGDMTQIVVSIAGDTTSGRPPRPVADFVARVGGAAPTAPAAPTVTATAGNGEVTLAWASVTGATKYQYAYARTGSTMGDWMPEDGQSMMTATVGGLTNEMEYTFYVRAGNDVGYSDPGMATAIPTAQEPITPAGPTDADVKSISIEGEEARTIGGTRRLHLMEGDRTELSITLDWSVQQLRDIYAADSTPSPVMVYFAVRPKTDDAEWLSALDLTGDGRDVLDARDAVSVKIPTKPRDTANANARVSSAAGKVRFAILEDDDAEAEGFTIEVLASESMGVSARSTSGNTLMTGTYAIDDDETQALKIKRISKGTIYETSDNQMFEVSADPALEDLFLSVQLDLVTADGSDASRAYGVVSVGNDRFLGGGDLELEVEVDIVNNDGNRVDDDLELRADSNSWRGSRARDDVTPGVAEFTVVDVHKLPPLEVNPMEGMVDEGDEFELTLTLDRNPRDTRAVSSETRQYTLEAVEIMLSGGAGTTAGMSDYRLPAAVKFDEHSGKASDGWTQEMKVKVMALEDNDLDDGEMLVLDAMVSGTKTANGDDKMAYTGVSSLTIGEGTGKLVWARSDEEVEAAVMAAKKAGMGDDMMFTAGEMIEIEGNDLFGNAEGVSVGYTATVEGDAVSESVSGGVVTITADSMGMAKVTITARASRPSGAVMINDQTDPREASITIALEVGLVALSIELSGPEDMNLVEGGMGGMVTATANRAVTEDTVVNLMRDRAMSSADDADFTAEPITIMAGQMKGSTMVMAVEDNMMENDGNMAEELVLYGMAADNAGEVTGHVKFYLWDAAVPALPVIAQLLLAAFLAVGGYRRYRRR